MKVAVLGSGAVGGSFAGFLPRRSDVEFTFCVRRPFDRLVVSDVAGTTIAEVDGRVLTEPSDAEPVDWVLLATKGHQVAGTAPWLARLCGPNTTVAVLQNGVEHVERT